MPENANSRNLYRFIFSPHSNSSTMRFSFTPAGEVVNIYISLAGIGADQHVHQNVDISVAPTINALTLSPGQAPVSPPQYSSAPCPAVPPCASTSALDQKPTSSQTVARLFEVMPPDIREELCAAWSETEPETEDEKEVLIEQNQLVRFFILRISQRRSQKTGIL